MESPENKHRHRYISILRCRTWHVWPEHTRTISEAIAIPVNLDKAIFLDGNIHLVSYDQRPRAKRYPSRPPRKYVSPPIWRGQLKFTHLIGETIVQAPEDKTAYKLHPEPAYKGEIDIQLYFATEYNLSPNELQEAAFGASLAAMAFINLRLGDLLTPVAPLHMVEIIGEQLVTNAEFRILGQERLSLDVQTLSDTTKQYGHIFRSNEVSESQKDKLRVALGLYATHFSERAATTRFLMLVMALETLANPIVRPNLTLNLMDEWKRQLNNIKSGLQPESEEFMSLEALERELLFRRGDSIRSQIKRLVFDALSGLSSTDATELSQRAAKVYDQRSLLVHKGTIPVNELRMAEKDAREILERVLKAKCQII